MQCIIDTNADLSIIESEIVHQIKLSYWRIYTSDYELNENSGFMVTAVNNAVLAGNQALREEFNNNPDVSYLTDADDVIFNKFKQEITPHIKKLYYLVGKYSSEYTLSVDMAQLMFPFVLQQIGVSNSELPIFAGLVFLITKYIINQVDERQKTEKIKKLDYDLKTLCSSNLVYLNAVNTDSMTEQDTEVINKCIEVNKEILESLEK